jgi:predicted nucleotidyltransferase
MDVTGTSSAPASTVGSGKRSGTALNAVCRRLPERVQLYLEEVMHACAQVGLPTVSLVLFGSTTKGGFSTVSDVDLIVVLADQATPADKRRTRDTVTRLEICHGFRPVPTNASGVIRASIERAAGHLFPCCVCTRGDQLSGDITRVLGLRRWETPFVDRIVFASIVHSAVTVSGEDLVSRVLVPRIRPLDVFKALFSVSCQLILRLVTFPVLADATKYAMAALKHSVQSCYFCYHRQTASLDQEVAFFNQRLGPSRTLMELLMLRRRYQRSFGFVIRCLPTILFLHLRTARHARFPVHHPALSQPHHKTSI